MLNNLREKNPDLKIFSVFDSEFKKYGRIVEDIDFSLLIKAGEKTQRPQSGSAYVPTLEAFEELELFKEVETKIFGQTPCQLGYCHGHSSFLNALEWHNCIELNVAVTDAVLILAKLSDLSTDKAMHSDDCKIFFVPKGAAIEVYSDTLHFCPCEVSKDGFGVAVGLVKDTNTPLDFKTEDKTLWAKNKWLLAHCDNEGLINRGAQIGIYGKNTQIKF